MNAEIVDATAPNSQPQPVTPPPIVAAINEFATQIQNRAAPVVKDVAARIKNDALPAAQQFATRVKEQASPVVQDLVHKFKNDPKARGKMIVLAASIIPLLMIFLCCFSGILTLFIGGGSRTPDRTSSSVAESDSTDWEWEIRYHRKTFGEPTIISLNKRPNMQLLIWNTYRIGGKMNGNFNSITVINAVDGSGRKMYSKAYNMDYHGKQSVIAAFKELDK